MLQHILLDFYQGVIASLSLTPVGLFYLKHSDYRKVIHEIVVYNTLFYVIPWLISPWIWIPGFLITIASGMFHVLYLALLTDRLCKDTPLATTQKAAPVQIMATQSIFSVTFFLIITLSEILNLILFGQFRILQFFLLSFYHSLYCYNNVWSFLGITVEARFHVHEVYWPYHIGYSALLSVLYILGNNPLLMMLYNIYLCALITLPFLQKPSIPQEKPYVSLNLSYLVSIVKHLFHLANQVNQQILSQAMSKDR